MLLNFHGFTNFLMVDDCNMDECLKSSWHLVYYQVSGEPVITGCSHQLDIYLRQCGLACKLITDHHHEILFLAFKIFAVGLGHKIILTAKFSRSTVPDCE